MARPIPELLPVTTAWRSLGTDLPLGDDALRQRHVVLLEVHEVVDRVETRVAQPRVDDRSVPEIGADALGVAAQKGPEFEVFVDGEAREDAASFGHLGQAAADAWDEPGGPGAAGPPKRASANEKAGKRRLFLSQKIETGYAKNAKGGALLQLPIDVSTTWTAYARALSKPNTSMDITSCGVDVGLDGLPNTADDVVICSGTPLLLERKSGKPVTINATDELLYVCVGGTGDTCLGGTKVALFSTDYFLYFWDVDNFGLRNAQIRLPVAPANTDPANAFAASEYRHAALNRGPPLGTSGECQAQRVRDVEVLPGRTLVRGWAPVRGCAHRFGGAGVQGVETSAVHALQRDHMTTGIDDAARDRNPGLVGLFDGGHHHLPGTLVGEALGIGDVHESFPQLVRGNCASGCIDHQGARQRLLRRAATCHRHRVTLPMISAPWLGENLKAGGLWYVSLRLAAAMSALCQ